MQRSYLLSHQLLVLHEQVDGLVVKEKLPMLLMQPCCCKATLVALTLQLQADNKRTHVNRQPCWPELKQSCHPFLLFYYAVWQQAAGSFLAVVEPPQYIDGAQRVAVKAAINEG